MAIYDMHSATDMASHESISNGHVKRFHLSTVSAGSRMSRTDNLSLATPRRRRAASSTIAWIKSATECLLTTTYHYKAQRRLTKKRRTWVKSSPLKISPIIATSHGPLLQQNTLQVTAVNLQKLASCSDQALSSNPATSADLKTARRARNGSNMGALSTAEKRRARLFDSADIASLCKALGDGFKGCSDFAGPVTTDESKNRESQLGDHQKLSVEIIAEEPRKQDSYWENQSRQHQAEITKLGEQAARLNRELLMLRDVSQHNERFHQYYKRKYETTAHQLEGTLHALRLIDNVSRWSPRTESSGYLGTPITEFEPIVLSPEDMHP